MTPNDPVDHRDESLDQLFEAFVTQRRETGSGDIESFIAAHPDHANELRELLPTVEQLEASKNTASSAPPFDEGSEAETVSQYHEENIHSDEIDVHYGRPHRLGDFVLMREIGRGGMGIVYEALQESLDRTVALKILPSNAMYDAKASSRFEREARAVAKMNHPNIVSVYTTGRENASHYFTMQLVDGVGLDAVIAHLAEHPDDRQQRLSALVSTLTGRESSTTAATPTPYIPQMVRVIRDAALALQHAHEQHLLHRDIKPANLLLDRSGRVYVTDFGLARSLDQGDVSMSRSIAGTLRYMAPEQLDGNCDEKSDIYGLGVTLYELVTLQPAFSAENQTALVHKVAMGKMAAVPKGCEIPSAVTAIIRKATGPKAKRYQNAAALADALNTCMNHLASPSATRGLQAMSARTRWLLASAVLLTLITGAWWLTRTANQEQQAASAAGHALPPTNPTAQAVATTPSTTSTPVVNAIRPAPQPRTTTPAFSAPPPPPGYAPPPRPGTRVIPRSVPPWRQQPTPRATEPPPANSGNGNTGVAPDSVD